MSFDEAAKFFSSSTSLNLPNQTKLEVYGLFKCVTVSTTPNTPRPTFFDMTGRAKWDSWNEVGKLCGGDSKEAEKRYMELAKSLGWDPDSSHVDETLSTAQNNTTDDEGIWDSEDASQKGKGAGMGVAVSVLSPPSPDERGDGDDIHSLALSGDLERLSILLSKTTANVNTPDTYGLTPLHLAADRGNPEIVEVLLKYGANPDIKDQDGYTAYELAEIAGHEMVLIVLKQR